jgi:hypothetical protein
VNYSIIAPCSIWIMQFQANMLLDEPASAGDGVCV